jgi:preprotein translocase subunit SecG
MGLVSILLFIIFIVSAILLIIIILLQDEQGEGLGGIFGGGSSTPFGSRSGNVLTKFTSILAGLFLFCSLAMAWLSGIETQDVGNLLQKARTEVLRETDEDWFLKTDTEAVIESGDESAGEADSPQADISVSPSDEESQ